MVAAFITGEDGVEGVGGGGEVRQAQCEFCLYSEAKCLRAEH